MSQKKKEHGLNECGNCGSKGASLRACSRCKLTHFCNPACQKQNWNAIGGHKKHCISVAQRIKISSELESPNDKDQEKVKCVICLENIMEELKKITLPCSHKFHFKCFTDYCASKTLPPCCPLCRSLISKEEYTDEITKHAYELYNIVIVDQAAKSMLEMPQRHKNDIAEAIKLATFAAKQGHSAAQCFLGLLFEKGNFVEKSDEHSYLWYRKSAEQGFVAAEYKLGCFMEEGRGTSVDKNRAIFWYKRAANQGNISAQISLGTIYMNANEFTTAFPWFMDAAKQGDKYAECIVGVLYFKHGMGIKNDEERYILARHWLEKSAKQGCAEAQANIDFIVTWHC